MSNYIFLHGLELKTKIGVPDFERESFQILHIDVDIELDNEPELDFIAPIVVGADSSQHSAIVDALKGKNMVIEGPPGTNKV